MTLMKPRYGNWVPNSLIRKLAVLFFTSTVLNVALWFLIPHRALFKVAMALVPIFTLIGTGYFFRAKWLFDARGGDIQNKVLDELVSRIEWNGNGQVLDIGCGSGALTIKVAKKYKAAKVTGIDHWGKGWDYHQKQCEENARIEGVSERVFFQQASASRLPFATGSFDLVVSNLTFHEVKDSKSKLDVLEEALRVVKKDGRFVFQDLFLLKHYYGNPAELTTAIKAMGVKKVQYVDSSISPFIPKALKLPFMLGALGLIYGDK